MGISKIRNAQRVSEDGLLFDSRLELFCWRALKDRGFPPSIFHCISFSLYPAEVLSNCSILSKVRKTKRTNDRVGNNSEYLLKMHMNSKLQPITYTIDFGFKIGIYTIIIETKGYANDSYPLRKKLLLHKLNRVPNTIFMELGNKPEVMEAMSYIDMLLKNENNTINLLTTETYE